MTDDCYENWGKRWTFSSNATHSPVAPTSERPPHDLDVQLLFRNHVYFEPRKAVRLAPKYQSLPSRSAQGFSEREFVRGHRVSHTFRDGILGQNPHDWLGRTKARSGLVGIELARASLQVKGYRSCPFGCKAGSQFHHGCVSRAPPIMPDGRVSQVRFEALAFRPWAFPFVPRFKRWCTYAPSSKSLLLFAVVPS